MMMEFLAPTAGGLLIGLAAGGLYLARGRMAGISGILGESLRLESADAGWRWSFLAGLLAGGVALRVLVPGALPQAIAASLPLLLAAGFLVGYGARLGGGCTSGHGVCGLAHGSARSLVATLSFMSVAVLTVYVARHLLAGVIP